PHYYSLLPLSSTCSMYISFSFSNAPAPTEIYTLSLHDALPILDHLFHSAHFTVQHIKRLPTIGSDHFPLYSMLTYTPAMSEQQEDRKSTRLNSSHVSISYAVFCLKKKTIHDAVFTRNN